MCVYRVHALCLLAYIIYIYIYIYTPAWDIVKLSVHGIACLAREIFQNLRVCIVYIHRECFVL